MATISSPGLGSGLDIASIVSQLMAVERRPLQALQSRQSAVQTQISAFGQLSSALSALQDRATHLTNARAWAVSTVTSSQPAAVQVTALSDSAPVAGTYAVAVNRLASGQSLVSSSTWLDSAQPVGSGRLVIERGTWAGPTNAFTPSAAAVEVNIPDGASTLAEVRDAINAANAGIGASVIRDASGARLALRSRETGLSQGFRVMVNDGDGVHDDPQGLSRLAYDPSTGLGGMTLAGSAGNAAAVIDGVHVSAETNVLNDVLPGLSVTLQQSTSTAATLTVQRDRGSLRAGIIAFAQAYNEVVALLRAQTQAGTDGTARGSLQGDSAATGLLLQVRRLASGGTDAAAPFERLSDIGLEPQRDGSLKINDARLSTALERLNDLQAFFSRDEAGTESDGFGVLFRSFASERLAEGGTLPARQAALRERVTTMNAQRERIEERLARTEERLTAQYSRLDTSLSKLNALQSYVDQQVKTWNQAKD